MIDWVVPGGWRERLRRLRDTVYDIDIRAVHWLKRSRREYDPEKAVWVVGSPRSGTTWLAGMIAQAPGYAMVEEPLHAEKSRSRRLGLSWRPVREPGVEARALRSLLADLLDGTSVSARELAVEGGAELLGVDTMVIKSVRSTRLLGWLESTFPGLRIIVLVRHPCAVVSSQREHRLFAPPTEVPACDRNYVNRHLQHLEDFLDELAHELEFRALTWSLDQHAHLKFANASDCTQLLFYEDLVSGAGDEILSRTVETLEIGNRDRLNVDLHEPSREARSFSVDHSRASASKKLSVWKRRLSDEETRRILRVVEKVGIAGYDSGLRPSGLSLDAAVRR